MSWLDRPALARIALNLYPPYLGTGISVRYIAPDWREIVVQMTLRWYNRNYVGTHFGGSLAAMSDPFYMLMLLHLLGPSYWVWDQKSCIEFAKPARGRVTARFTIDDSQVEAIRQATAGGQKLLTDLDTDIVDESTEVVARVRKTLYIRLKPSARLTP